MGKMENTGFGNVETPCIGSIDLPDTGEITNPVSRSAVTGRSGMRHVHALLLCLLVGFGVQCFQPQPVMAQEPILETYVIRQGGSSAVSSLEGFTAQFKDPGFGGSPGQGTAKSIIRFETLADRSKLFLRVYREELPPDTTAFALIVESVKVRGFDFQGRRIYALNLEGFIFGDSSSGNWSRTLSNLPANVARLQITFYGNYE